MSSPAAPNLPPQPIDDPHMRVANHEDLLPSDYDEIVDRMLDSPDDFAAWEAELRALDATPTPTPEDERNKEKLAIVFDRPALTETVEAAEEPEKSDGPQMYEVGQLLQSLGQKAERSQRIFDFAADRDEIMAGNDFKSFQQQMRSAKLDKDELYDIYTDQILEPQQAALMTAIDNDLTELAAILKKHPNQWRFVAHAAEERERNVASAHDNLTEAEAKTTEREEAVRYASATRLIQVEDGKDEHGNKLYKTIRRDNAPLGGLERADTTIHARDAAAAQEISQHHHNITQRAADNFRGFMRILEAKGAVPDEGGEKVVADFLTNFEAANDRNIDEALKDLKEGENFRVYLEAGSDPDERAKAEQPIWRDVEYTGRAAKQLKVMLDDMKSKGMSRAHSHYREVYAKFAEVQRAHVATWQRWQTVRQAHAVERNPLGAPDFQGRRAVIVAGDQQKGIYVMEGPSKPFTVVYPDSSLRSIAFDPAGKPVPGDRINLDGSEWTAPDPITLTYEEAAPAATTTAGIMGRVAMVRNVAGRNHERTDDRDIPTLVTAYKDALFQAHMDPSNPQVVAQAYDITRLLEQRTAEQIDVIEAVDPADRTPEQDANLATLRHSRGALQARAKYLEHGSEGNLSTMNPDASINFRGTMYDEERPRDWRVALTGDAIKQFAGGAQQVYRADGTRV